MELRAPELPRLIHTGQKEIPAGGDRANDLGKMKPSQDSSNDATEMAVVPLSLSRLFSAGSAPPPPPPRTHTRHARPGYTLPLLSSPLLSCWSHSYSYSKAHLQEAASDHAMPA